MGGKIVWGKAFLVLFLSLCLMLPAGVWAKEKYPDFEISEAYLKKLYNDKTIQFSLPVTFKARTNNVHKLADDCEMHLAGMPEGIQLGNPNDIVVEPPNLCKYGPSGDLFAEGESSKVWLDLMDSKVMGKTCDVVGFPRIFTEHASGSASAANPNHVFEIHPALGIKCGDDNISFANYMTVFEGMRAVKPSTAQSCMEKRTLEVRYNKNNKSYEVYGNGGQCGNFAVVEVSTVNKDWVRALGGGHSAIARVSPDGQSTLTLKIYTFSGIKEDKWLDDIMKKDSSSDRVFLHGMLTYDYFSIIKTVRTKAGNWSHAATWKTVDFPLAFVVFGTTQTVPWEEE